MSLWEREADDALRVDERRAQHVAKLDTEREAEAAEAAARFEQFRREDEARTAAEAQKRLDDEAAQQAEMERMAQENAAARAAEEEAMKAEQAQLKAEQDRQAEAAKARIEAAKPKPKLSEDFSYSFEPGMEGKVKAFRQRGQGGDALIIKIDHEQGLMQIEETFKGSTIEAIAERLEDFELAATPRYLLYIHKFAHRDGRVQYPIAFVLFMPSQIPLELKVLYTRPVTELTGTFAVNRHHVLDDCEDFTAEWIENKLGLVKK